MKFLEYIQQHKLFIHYLTLAIVVIGIASLLSMRREARPNVNFNRVNISVVYPGASPSDIEELIIDPIEEKIAEVDGIKEYRSISYAGAGSISVKIDDSYSNIEEIVDEIRRKVAEVKELPEGVNDPSVTEAKAINIPVLSLALFGDVSPSVLKTETEKLKDFLQRQKGVQSVSYSGISDLQLKIMTDPKKLDKFDITLDEIMVKLSGWAKQRPGGLFENDQYVVNLTVGKDLNQLENLNNFIIRSNDSGRAIRLKDVAEIGFDLKSLQSGSIFEDKEAVLFTVVKKPFYDSIDVVDRLNVSLEKYSKNLNKSLQIKAYKDQSIRIRDKLKIVTVNALSGLFLVLIILLIFLDWRSALVTSIGIPVAMLGGVCLLYFMGQTMNSLVVIGMIIVLGMLVDDAIVVCENIYSYIEKGFTPAEAAIKGAAEISLPVLASVLTTIFAFLPIVFMEGIIGQFLSVIPLTVVALLAVSLFEALFILPTHAEELMRVSKKKKKNFFKKVESYYVKYLNWSIRFRYLVLTLLILFFIGSAFQGKKIFERFSLFPADGLEGLSIRMELPKNTPISQTKQRVKEISKELLAVSDNTFDNIFASIGQVRTGGSSGSRQNGSHLASVNVSFVSDPSFQKKEKLVLKNIRAAIKEYTEGKDLKTSLTLDRPGPPIGKPIQFQVTARDFEVGEGIVNQIKDELTKIEGVNSLETDLDGDSIKYRLIIDNELAVSDGIEPTKISRTIFASSTGVVASEILKNNEKIEILLSVTNDKSQPVQSILNLKVRNQGGNAVPIREYVKIKKEKSPSSIQRLDGIKTITLFGEVADAQITGKEVNAQIRPFISQLKQKYQSVTIATGGGEKDRLNAVKDTFKLYGFALLIIFMIISLTFQSVLYPFLVLTAVPMGLSGVVWSLVAHGKSLSIMGIIGIVGLSGVVVNVSIIFLKFVQDRLDQNMDFKEAVMQAAVTRLRPIIMTTLSTLIGLLPTIYGVGGVDTFVQPIALVLGWGLFVATLLTILTLPALVSFFPILKKN